MKLGAFSLSREAGEGREGVFQIVKPPPQPSPASEREFGTLEHIA